MKRRIEFYSGKAVFTGAMTPEAIRSKAEDFEALAGHYPVIMLAAPTMSAKSVMSGQPMGFIGPRPVITIHRLFVRVDMGGGRHLDIIPEQVPDLVVEYHLVQ